MPLLHAIAARKPLKMLLERDSSVSLFVERRWGAVLAVDVVGYSRLTSLDEERTYLLYKSVRHELIDPKIIEHHARFMKSTGDGVLAEFTTAIDATRCAFEVQTKMVNRCKAVADDRRIVLRIGLSCGRILADPEDIYGHEVNVAARLQTVAPPGGIAMSSEIAELTRGALQLQLDDLGMRELRNMCHPVHVFQCRLLDREECKRA